MTPKFVLLNCR